jgi:ABC-2 type transport system ATP-binding protein
VTKGEVLGFLGPNGAGKSTTMRMVTGFYPATSGTVLVEGVDIGNDPLLAKEKIGYLPENAPLYEDMNVQGFLRFCAGLRGFDGAERERAVDRAIETTFLEPVRHQSIDTLSKGYRHRTCLAQSIIHDPDILILDEPTDGLDPNQKHEVRSLIKRMGEEKAIIFSTHILEEVEAACTRAVIIDRGRIVADGTPEDLKGRADDAKSLRVRILAEPESSLEQEIGKLGTVAKVAAQPRDNGAFEATVFPAKRTNSNVMAEEVFKLCAERGWKLQELHVVEGRLDDVFRKITRPDTEL